MTFPYPTFERTILVACITGSHNYNLNGPSSDEDWKYFVAPTFDDLYEAKTWSHAEQTETFDYSAHDIRKLADLIAKANINFIEVLFSVKRFFDPELADIFMNAERFAAMNRSGFWSAAYGMHTEKMNALHKGTEKTDILVETYGYDTKQACHALRVLYVLERYAETGSMEKALWFSESDYERPILLGVKAGHFTEDTFKDIVADWNERNYARLREYYKSFEFNHELKGAMDSIVRNLIRRWMK